jgi:hypothetical protein
VCGIVLILLKISPYEASQTPHITNPARARSSRFARRVHARPETTASTASGYSQPISGPYSLPSSLVQPEPKLLLPPAPPPPPKPGAAAAPVVLVAPVVPVVPLGPPVPPLGPPVPPLGPPVPPVVTPGPDVTAPLTLMPNRSSPLYPNTMAIALLSVDPST